MMKLFNSIKKFVKEQDKQPKYRSYTHTQLKLIAMRTRIIFEQMYKKELQKIQTSDHQFKKLQQQHSPINKQYEVLQQIGKKVIEVETIKLLIEIVKKIQAYAPQLINKKGDIQLMKLQLNWFQCILWFRKCKKLNSIEEFNTFCWNFFKGNDITTQLNMKCELFKIYPGLQYLDDTKIVPLDQIVKRVTPYVSFAIDQKQLDDMKIINEQQIKQREEQQKNKQSLNNPLYPVGNPYQNQNNSSNTNPNRPQSYNNPYYSLPHDHHALSKDPYGSSPINKFGQPHDSEFALDPFSRMRSVPVDNNIFNPSNDNRNYQPSPQNQQNQNSQDAMKKKKFTSPNLNLIDWQKMYEGQNGNAQDNEFNSTIGLLPDKHDNRNNFNNLSQNYPTQSINKDKPFYPSKQHISKTYESDPNQSRINLIQPQPKNPNNQDFLDSIQNEFFNPTISNNHQVNLIKPEQQVNPPTKSLNRLFGFKMKSSIDSQQQSKSQQSSKQQKSEEFTPIDNTNINNVIRQQPQSMEQESQIDKLMRQLNINNSSQQSSQSNHNKIIDEPIQPQQPQTSQNGKLTQQISQLIELHKKRLSSPQNSIYDSQENINGQQVMQKQSYNVPDIPFYQSTFKPYQSSDNQRLQSSSIRIKQQQQHFNPSNHTQQNQSELYPYQKNFQQKLQPDLLQSLSFIKNHLNPQLSSQNSNQIINTIVQTQNEQPPSQPISPSKNIKKPYMVSIYARNQFINQLNNRINQQNQKYY